MHAKQRSIQYSVPSAAASASDNLVASTIDDDGVASSTGKHDQSHAPALDRKAFADQFEQRMQAKVEKENEDSLTKVSRVKGAPANSKAAVSFADDQFEQRMQAKLKKEKHPSSADHVTCAAGRHCMADPEIATDLTKSPHECLNCYEKMHDPSTCGEMFDDVEDIHGFDIPTHMLSEVGQQQLREQVGASNLAICCMCIERLRLPCLLKEKTAETSMQAAKEGLDVVEGSPPAPIQDSIYQDSVKGKLNMKLESVGDGDEAPKPSAYTAAAYEEMDAAIKRAVRNTPHMSPPVPPAAEAKMAAMVEDTDIESKKKAFLSPDGVGGNGREPPVLTPSADREQQNALSEDPVQSAVPRAQAQQTAPTITRPPPRSMLPSNQQSTPSLPVLQATLVEDEPQAPVYDAIPLQSSGDQSVPWWKRRATLGMGCIIVVLVATFGAVVGSLRDGSASTTSLAPTNPPPEKSVTIGGYVFNDANNNGYFDEVMDEAIPNIRVSVFACPSMDSSSSIANSFNAPLMLTRTNSTGYYMFRNALPEGEYLVSFEYCVDQIIPGSYECYIGSSTWSGSGGSSHLDADSNANPDTGVTKCMQFDEGGVYLNINAGMRYIQSSSALLSSMLNAKMCPVAALDSRTSPTASTHQPYGFLFSIENDGTERVGLSALSVMLDSSSCVNYTLYLLDGPYITETGDDGTITGSAIGMELSSQQLNSQSTSSNHTVWVEVARGEYTNFVVDEDGATLITFSSLAGGQTIGLEPGGINSFYLKMSGIALSVENGNGLVGEAVDELASVSSGVRSGLKLYVGRGVMIKDNWIDVTGFPANAFDAMYSPARLIGKVWTEEACPHYYLALTDDFWFYVSAPPGVENQAQIERDIIGNVTKYYRDLFTDLCSLLYPFVRDYGLSIADIPEPLKVNLIEKNDANDDDRCIKDNKPENSANVCYSYALEIIFEHSRNIPGGVLKGWILEESNDISGNLVATHQDQQLAFCWTISDELIESRYLLNYSLLNVDCTKFDFFDPIRDRGLLRRTQEGVVLMNVTFTVTGEYRPDNSYWQPQEAAEKHNEFGNRVEDSINADNGKKLITALREREVMVAEDSTASGYELFGNNPSDSSRAQNTTNQTPSENPTINDEYSTTGINRTTTLSIILGLLICMLILMATFTYRECIRRREQAEEENSDEASS